MRTRSLLVVLLAGVLVATSAGTANAKLNSDFWGINFNDAPVSGSDLSRLHGGRIDNIRWIFYWASMQPTEGGPINFSRADQVIGDLASRGISVLPELFGSPGYAAGTPYLPPIDSTQARQDWTSFLQQVVQRYKPGGTYWTQVYPSQHPGRKPVPIRNWQVWNEPNLPNHFTAASPVQKYATLLRISHDAIKAADSHAKVVLAGLAAYRFGHLAEFRAWDFLSQLYKAHLKSDFDIVGLHPYASNKSQLLLAVKRMRGAMRRHGDARTLTWFSEIGWGSQKPSRGAPLNKGLQGQKKILQQLFTLIAKRHFTWKVKGVSFYDWQDPNPNSPPGCTFCLSTGLIRYNGQPKPAWGGYKAVIRRFPSR